MILLYATLKRYFLKNVLKFLITDTCLGLIGPHQCDAEYPIDRKILSAIW